MIVWSLRSICWGRGGSGRAGRDPRGRPAGQVRVASARFWRGRRTRRRRSLSRFLRREAPDLGVDLGGLEADVAEHGDKVGHRLVARGVSHAGRRVRQHRSSNQEDTGDEGYEPPASVCAHRRYISPRVSFPSATYSPAPVTASNPDAVQRIRAPSLRVMTSVVKSWASREGEPVGGRSSPRRSRKEARHRSMNG